MTVLDRKIGRLDKGPGQISITVLAIVLAFLFTVALTAAVDTTAIRGKITRAFKAGNIARLEQNRLGQYIAYTRE